MRLEQIRAEATSIAGTAVKISQAINEVLDRGGMTHIQPQMAFLTSAIARMTKDWGVVEHLQSLGTSQRKPSGKNTGDR